MGFNHKGHCLFYQTQLPLCVYLFRHECIKVFNIHHPSSNCHFLHQYSIDSCMNADSFRSFFMVPVAGHDPAIPLGRSILSAECMHSTTPALVLLVLRKRVELLIQLLTWPWILSPVCIPFPASEALLGRSEKIRTFNTHGLNVRPLPIGIRFH